jgi:anti-anti-sigma factor
MSITVDKRGEGTAVLGMPQNVVRDGVGEMGKLARELADEGIQRVVLDFGSTRRVDSHGLGQVVAFHMAMKKARIPFCIAGIKDTVKELFSLTNLDKIIEIYDSVPEALEALH